MENYKILSVAKKLKKPLSISGLVFIVLYLIYDKVLSLDIFEKLSSESTFTTINNILNKVYWLAIIALILGVVSYLVTFLIKSKNKKESDVEILSANNDDKKSDYTQSDLDEKKVISREE